MQNIIIICKLWCSGGTVCFETSGNKWDRKYQDWYCGNSPQCRDTLLSTLTPNYLLFWWPDFLQSQPPHTFLLPEKFPKLPVSKCPELVWPVTGLITGGVYLLLQKLSFISLGLKFPNNPVILGPGYFFFNNKKYTLIEKRVKRVFWICDRYNY